MDRPHTATAPPVADATNRPPPAAPATWTTWAPLAGTLVLTLALLWVPPAAVAQLGAWGYAGVFGLTLLSSATLVLPSPALGVALVAARTLDPWGVGLVAGAAAALGESTGYLAGRAGTPLAARSRWYPRVAAWVARRSGPVIFLLAAVPGPLLDLAGIAAGALGVPFGRYLLACWLGKTLRFIGVAWLGHALG